ncbi:hypothetical protein [Microvirga solisilvae]|nr:hypothetical protein [Microvirga solisilvae]
MLNLSRLIRLLRRSILLSILLTAAKLTPLATLALQMWNYG